MLFSVLIPVYNAENYLDGCLRSVLDQTDQDFEIVLCDDGSTDGSPVLCMEYAARYPEKMRLLQNEKNEGPLLTRRRLFFASSGEYLLYVDADDQLETNTIYSLKEAILKTDADMVVFNAACIHKDRSVEHFVPSLLPNHLYEGSEKAACYDAFFQNKYLNSLCTKAIKRQIVDCSIDYEPWKDLCLGEDRFQSLPLFDQADSIYHLDQTLYRYYKRENSITTSAKPRFYEMRKMLWEREDLYISTWHLSKEVMETAYRNRCNEIINFAKSLASAKPYLTFKKEVYQIRQDGWLSRAMKETHLSGRYRIYGDLLSQKRDRFLYSAMSAEEWIVRIKTQLSERR